MDNNHDQIKELIKGYRIKSKTTGGLLGIEPENLSLHKNVLLVNERIWVPKTLTQQFCTNLHMGHRAAATMLTLAGRSCYWAGMKLDIESFCNTCADCTDHMNRNKHQEHFP